MKASQLTNGCLTSLLLIFFLSPQVNAKSEVGAQVKAAYLYQFIKYVHWPEDKSPESIGLVSPVDISSQFHTIDGKLFNERELKVRHITSLAEERECCDVFYFAPGSESQLSKWAEKFPAGIITVADDKLENGELAMIQFLRRATRLKFAVHDSIAKRSRVKFSSRLLRVALTVD